MHTLGGKVTRYCRKCGVGLGVGESWYPSCAKKQDYICIECHKAGSQQRREENPDYQRQWHEAHPDYETPLIICKGCGKEKPAHGHGLCPQCYDRQYERPTMIECGKCGEEKKHHAHGLCQQCYDYQWVRENPVKNRAQSRRRRAFERGVPVNDLTVADWQAVLDYYGHKCAYCGKTKDFTQDHIIPLSRGGWHTISNIAPACRSCNSKKGVRTPAEAGMYLWQLPLIKTLRSKDESETKSSCRR